MGAHELWSRWHESHADSSRNELDLPEVILEVMSWEPPFVAASGEQTRLADLHVTIAACLTAHALNIGYSPIVKKAVPALERDRISHVNQSYL